MLTDRHNGFHQRVFTIPVDPITYVYAISDGYAIKLGKSDSHPITRLKTLQTGNPRTLTLIAYTTTITERKLHRKPGLKRLRGEWFIANITLLQEISKWDWVNPLYNMKALTNDQNQ